MFSCNVDGILNDLPGVAFIDKAADWKAAPIGGFNMPPEHSELGDYGTGISKTSGARHDLLRYSAPDSLIQLLKML